MFLKYLNKLTTTVTAACFLEQGLTSLWRWDDGADDGIGQCQAGPLVALSRRKNLSSDLLQGVGRTELVRNASSGVVKPKPSARHDLAIGKEEGCPQHWVRDGKTSGINVVAQLKSSVKGIVLIWVTELCRQGKIWYSLIKEYYCQIIAIGIFIPIGMDEHFLYSCNLNASKQLLKLSYECMFSPLSTPLISVKALVSPPGL